MLFIAALMNSDAEFGGSIRQVIVIEDFIDSRTEGLKAYGLVLGVVLQRSQNGFLLNSGVYCESIRFVSGYSEDKYIRLFVPLPLDVVEELL